MTLASRIAWTARLELALARGDAERALSIVDQMTACAPNAAGRVLVALALPHAAALVQRGRSAEAVAVLSAARAAAMEQGMSARLWQFDAALAGLHHAAGRTAEARQAEAAARERIEAIAAMVPEGKLRACFLESAARQLPNVRRAAARQMPGGLTARELEVAALVGRGLSNRAIADHLVLGERTVETHVSNILAKLGFDSRAQIAAWATEQRIVMRDA